LEVAVLVTSESDPSAHSVLLALSGEIDAATAPEAFARLVYAEPCPGDTVAIDLSDVTFMDSTGVSMLLKARNYLDVMGCRLVLENPSAPVVRLFTILGLNEQLL
jgi:anti-sigma B factor antagonist